MINRPAVCRCERRGNTKERRRVEAGAWTTPALQAVGIHLAGFTLSGRFRSSILRAMGRLHVVQSRLDKQVAERFVDALKKTGHSVSSDFTYLVAGVEWNRSLREAVLGADGLLAILSENSVDRDSGRITSQWIAADIGAARASGKFLLPVLVGKDCPIPTLVDDVFALRLPRPDDKRAFADILRQTSDAIAYHLEQRVRESILALPPGYQHLASSVLRCREDTPYDKSV